VGDDNYYEYQTPSEGMTLIVTSRLSPSSVLHPREEEKTPPPFACPPVVERGIEGDDNSKSQPYD